jgi:hypothetical protein
VYNVEPSRHAAATAYVQFDFHQVNNRNPYVYKTADYGKTWKAITNGIPLSVTSYTHCIREDPVRSGLLYLGTENAIYVSFNDGEHWDVLQGNLPHAPVYWITIPEHFNDLVLATYGRGFWILDDITWIQQLTERVRESAVHLFTPRPAYRFRTIPAAQTVWIDPTVGQNPAYGASINYWLNSIPDGDIRIQILDDTRETIRTLKGSKLKGINRVQWDLRHETSMALRLRTSPAFAPEVGLGPEGWRPAPEGGRMSLLAVPGTYTVKLIVDSQEQSQPLIVRKDPNSAGTEPDIQAQTSILRDLRNQLVTAVDMVNHIEIIRRQLEDLMPLLESHPQSAALKRAAGDLEQKVLAVEDRLIQRKLTDSGQDMVRWPAQLISKLTHLGESIGGSDDAPTTQARQVYENLKQQIAALRDQLGVVVSRDVASLNTLLRNNDIPVAIIATPDR